MTTYAYELPDGYRVADGYGRFQAQHEGGWYGPPRSIEAHAVGDALQHDAWSRDGFKIPNGQIHP